jgi:hypothetical protein
MGGATVLWTSVFLDTPASLVDWGADFWSVVTGASPGGPVGTDDEFLPLDPSNGDTYVWLQRLRAGPVAVHPDLYVEDVGGVAAAAEGLGATRRSTSERLVVLASPGGLPFCLVTHRGQAQRPEPVGAPGARSVLDQICLDIPPSAYDAESAFWAELTGWERLDQEPHDEFERLRRPDWIPLAFLLQRLDDEQPAVTAHLDLAADDREAETARHQQLGAELVHRAEHWTVLRDPVGRRYCITARRPGDV